MIVEEVNNCFGTKKPENILTKTFKNGAQSRKDVENLPEYVFPLVGSNRNFSYKAMNILI